MATDEPSTPSNWRGRALFVLLLLGGALFGAAVARIGRHVEGLPSALWILLVLATLVLLPAGLAQRRMVRDGKISSATFPRDVAYRQTAIMWAVMLALGLWVLRGHASPFARSAFAWPSGAGGVVAFGVVAAVLLWLARWARLLPTHRRKRAWLRAVYRQGASLIAPRNPRELTQFRATVLLTSTAEEVVYRIAVPGGFVAMLGAFGLGMNLGEPWMIGLSVALSSLLFGVAHAYQGSLGVLWTTGFGLVAAALTLGSGSIWPAVVLHVGWNLIMSGMMYEIYRGPRGRTSERAA
jgi:membrane protease YdiL (CAAX protease family)